MAIRFNIQCPKYNKIIGVLQINSTKDVPHTDPDLVDLRFKCKRCKKFHWVSPRRKDYGEKMTPTTSNFTLKDNPTELLTLPYKKVNNRNLVKFEGNWIEAQTLYSNGYTTPNMNKKCNMCQTTLQDYRWQCDPCNKKSTRALQSISNEIFSKIFGSVTISSTSTNKK